MASPSATMSTTAAASSFSLHPRLTFRDTLSFVLFLVLPIYARFCISPSISSVFRHIYIIGTTGTCIVHFSGGMVSFGQVRDVIYGLAISSFPGLSRSCSLIAWIVPDIEGWRGIVIHWVFIATHLIFLLPENYGSDVEALRAEYKKVYPLFSFCVGVFSGIIVWCSLGRRGHSWYDVLVIWEGLTSFFEYVCLIRLNYICLCRFGKTVRENSWPYKDKFKKPWPFTDAYGREFTIKEVIQWHSTGSISPRA